MESRFGIIVLAAGSSSRLGSPKQLLPFAGSTLLQHIVTTALAVPAASVVVVTGANRGDVEQSLQDERVAMTYNAEWQSGMASSIQHGLSRILSDNPSVEACIIAVCDQPYVNVDILNGLITAYEQTGKGICASAYGGTIGTPALFDKRYFSDLQSLSGDHGAKKILKTYAEDVATILFDGGEVDVDTPADYKKIAEA